MSDNPANQAELLSIISREWTALMDVVARLDETQMTTPDDGGWSPKDNLAHLAEWMKILLGYHMDNRPSHEVIGVSPEVTEDWDSNVINGVLFERNRGRSMDDVLDELKRVYAEVCDKIKSTPFESLMKSRWPDDPESPTVLWAVLVNTRDHFAEHRETMEKVFED